MKVLITVGLIIVFVSVFFTLFILDRALSATKCEFDAVSGKTVCTLANSAVALTGILLVGLFVLISIIVSYVLISTVTSKSSICFGSAAARRGAK